MSNLKPTSKDLQPFGIRDLHGLDKRPGIVHISALQYDSTLTSFPDATLTYTDEDDGETITVGSGLELEQRLMEPIARRGRRLSRAVAQSPSYASLGDQKIHLFDIRPTPENLIVWSEHEAYSSKTLREQYGYSPEPTIPSVTHVSDPTEDKENSLEETADPPIVVPSVSKSLTALANNRSLQTRAELVKDPEACNTPLVPQPQSEQPVVNGLDSLEKPIAMFVDFLDSTADILRNTAQKTRDSDSTPIETFLNGMKNIFTEVGQLGLEVLQTIEADLLSTKQTENTVTTKAASKPSESADVAIQRTSDIQKRVSFANLNIDKPSTAASLAQEIKLESTGHNFLPHSMPTTALTEAPCSNKASEVDPSKELARKWNDLRLESATQSAKRSERQYHESLNLASSIRLEQTTKPSPFDVKEAKETEVRSIMDHDHINSDFLAKYPPLTSLRRAKTLNNLKQPPKPQDHLSHQAALTRYPSISQLQSQQGHEIKEPAAYLAWKPPTIPLSTTAKMAPPRLWTGYEPSTGLGNGTTQYSSVVDSSAKKDLPGAWPDTKSEEFGFLPTVNSLNGTAPVQSGSNGAATRPARPVSPALSCRNTSPPQDLFLPSATGVKRANTITASNPAARLTTPFDPGFDVSKGHSSASNVGSQGGPRWNVGPRRVQSQRNPMWYEPPNLATGFPNSQLGSVTNGDANLLINRGSQRPAPALPGAWPYPTVPKPSSQYPANRVPRPMRSEPNFAYPKPTPQRRGRSGLYAPPPSSTSKVDACVKSLREMGYGKSNPNEAARLNVYASAAAGDVMEALEMIEDDRQAAEAMKLGPIRTL